MNPVEVMYAAFPMFLYVNASYGGGLLTPLLEYQASNTYTLPYAASDIGKYGTAAEAAIYSYPVIRLRISRR